MSGIRKVVKAPAGHAINVVASPLHQKPTSSGERGLSITAELTAGPGALKVVPQNAEDVWPFRQKELLVEINKEISPSINGYDITCLNAEYDLLKKHPEFVYKPHKMASPQYSAAFVKWVVEQFKKDPKLFIRARAYYSRRIRNRKR